MCISGSFSEFVEVLCVIVEVFVYLWEFLVD